MKSTATANDNRQQGSEDKSTRPPSRRYFVRANLRIAVLSIVYFVVLWAIFVMVFPTTTHGQEVAVRSGMTAANETTRAPFSVKSARKDAYTGTIQWKFYPWTTHSLNEGCGEESEWSRNPESEKAVVEWEFVYHNPVGMYSEGPLRKIGRFIDIFRATDAARDQMGMKLYDVDTLTEAGYRTLLEAIESAKETAGLPGKNREDDEPTGQFMAFVMPMTAASAEHASALDWIIGKEVGIQFMGTPVSWNKDIENLFRYEAGEVNLATTFTDWTDDGKTKLMKAAMYSVMASAQGKFYEEIDSVPWFCEMRDQKMYIAIAPKSIAPKSDEVGLEPIPTVSFRSAWNPESSSLTYKAVEEMQ